MIKFGIIGTSWISRSFLDAAALFEELKFTNLFALEESHAKDFLTSAEDVKVDTEMTKFFANDFDFVYIASPNAFHYEQAKMALEAGKHVFLEKAFTTNVADAEELFWLAQSKNLLILEAITSLSKPNLFKAKAAIEDFKFGAITKAEFSYCMFNQTLADFRDSKFSTLDNPRLIGPPINQLTVYPVHLAFAILGLPNEVTIERFKTKSYELDAEVTMKYANFELVGKVSKLENEPQSMTIYSERNTLKVSMLGIVEKIELNGVDISDPTQHKENLYHELVEFVTLLKSGKLHSDIMTIEQTINVVKVVEADQTVKF